MDYIKGHLIKPKSIDITGAVTFTNGTDNCLPNRAECEAYGYYWDNQSKTCQAYPPNNFSRVMDTVLIVGNETNGRNNEVKEGSYYNSMNGADNTIGKEVQNSIVSGKGNEIIDTVDNASVSGSYAKSQRQSEVALGGGNYGQDVSFNGYAQSSTIHCIVRTSGSGTVEAPVAGVTGTWGLINIQTHSNIIFKLTGVAVKEAGGDYISYTRYIVAKMANDGEAEFCLGTPTMICDSITPEEWTYPYFLQTGDAETGWGGLRLMVTGLAEIDLMHNIKLELLETRNLTNY